MVLTVYSLFWVMQDFGHQPYCLGFRVCCLRHTRYTAGAVDILNVGAPGRRDSDLGEAETALKANTHPQVPRGHRPPHCDHGRLSQEICGGRCPDGLVSRLCVHPKF